MSSMGILRPPDVHAGNDYEGYFISMLVSAEAREVFKDVILVFDEPNHFCSVPKEFKNNFIDTLRHLKQMTGSRLLSLMFMGTNFLLEHLYIANSYRKILEFKSSSGSKMSPFSHDGKFTTSKFTVGKMGILLAQYKTFFGVHVEDAIAAHIHALTRGYKGLVGVCCFLLESNNSMREDSSRTFLKWNHFAKMELNEKTFTGPTYQNMLNNCHKS
ncbi:hypothetical protein L7F22_023116 [Adiantum nelumboides]|nr:hypothetical protein [Adiantum nelumboides]